LINIKALIIPDTGKPFEVYNDTSHLRLGSVLMLEKKVVAYASQHLKVHEKIYPTLELELVAIVFSLKQWKHFIYRAQFKVFNDHKELEVFD